MNHKPSLKLPFLIQIWGSETTQMLTLQESSWPSSSGLRLLKHPDLWTEHLPCFQFLQSKESHCWTTQTMLSTLGARGCWVTLIEEDCSSSGAATEWMKRSVSERHGGRKQSFPLQSLFSWATTAGVTNIPNVFSHLK